MIAISGNESIRTIKINHYRYQRKNSQGSPTIISIIHSGISLLTVVKLQPSMIGFLNGLQENQVFIYFKGP